MKDFIEKFKTPIIAIIVAILAATGGGLLGVNINTDEDGKTTIKVESAFNIELPQADVIETDEGVIEVTGAPTVESVDSENSSALSECNEDETECGLGAFIYAPTDTPFAFYDYTKNQCLNTDGAYGSQCWDYGDVFWQNYAGRRLSTCGTGAAKGAWEGDGGNCKYVNAGNDFELITDPKSLQAGDWLIFNNGTWGHVGMALGGYNKGYIALAGQNQGGAACAGGGGAVNVINISLNNFVGAFRPKSYIKPEPKPEPEPTPAPQKSCDRIEVKQGDTLGKIMLRCEGKVVWGEAMDEYAKSWKSAKYGLYPTVYDGWTSERGYGLFAGDVIERQK